MKFLTLLNALKRILFRKKKERQSEKSLDTQQSWSQGELVGICVGHSRKGDKGAVNVYKQSEWDYNLKVALSLKKELSNLGIDSYVYGKYEGRSYREAMKYIAKTLKKDKATLALELHFNAFNGEAFGCSMLYNASSTESRSLSKEIQFSVLKTFKTLNRGARGLKRKDRGWLFVNNPSIPTVLCEPFFGDNKKDCKLFSDTQGLAKSYAEGIKQFLVGKANK